MKFKFLILAIFVFCQYTRAQKNCDTLLDYGQSQIWVKRINLLTDEERKKQILARIACEEGANARFSLTLIINGSVAEPPYFRRELFQLVNAKEIQLLPSICEAEGIFPQRCNLGFIVIDTKHQPIINEIAALEVIKVKRLKHQITLSIRAQRKTNIQLSSESFNQKGERRSIQQLELKKGISQLDFTTHNELMIIEVWVGAKKMIILS